jgi:hypothetical protein
MGDGAPGDRAIELAGLARGLEAHGIYNGAKLVRALLERKLAEAAATSGGTIDAAATGAGVARLADDLEAAGEDAALVAALRAAAHAAATDAPLPMADAPRTWSCRGCGRIFIGSLPDVCPTCESPAAMAREQLPVWYLEPMSSAAALEGLQAGLDALIASVEGRSDEALAVPPRPGEWSVRETLQHLVAAEELLSVRVPRLLAEDDPELVATSAWVLPASDEATVETEQPASVLLARLREMREASIALLADLGQDGWARTGRHPEWGSVTVTSQAAYFARHLWSHLAQVRAAADGRIPGDRSQPD